MAVVGDIFVATWGYDQTNADFFQVTGVTAKGVKVRHIKSRISAKDDRSMTGYSVPIKNAFDGETKTKMLRDYEGEEIIRMDDSMGSARKWNGNPVGISWYA